MLKIITVIPYVDNIYCQATLGEMVMHKQTNGSHGLNREININYNRHETQQLVKEQYSDAELVLLMDSDVIATDEQLNALLSSFKGIPLALRTKDFDTKRHICCACCLLKMEDYLKIDYINEYVDDCQCSKIMRLFDVKYLDGYQAHEYQDRPIISNMFHNEIVGKHILNPTPDIQPIDLSLLGTGAAK